MEIISNLSKVKDERTFIYLILIITVGLSIRFYYLPFDIPIITDGFFNFVYAAKTSFELSLPINYLVANSGWSNFLSLFFIFLEKNEPMFLMNFQRSLSAVISIATIIPVFFVLRRFVKVRYALLGCLMLALEPRLLLISIEGVNYNLFLFLFVLSIALFLKRTNLSLVLSFVCIACMTIVRYEGLLLVVPFTIMYFFKFRNKKKILLYIGMIFSLTLILITVGMLRMDATQDICNLNNFDEINCGRNGYEGILSGFEFFNKFIISGEQMSPKVVDNEAYEIHKELYNKPGEQVIGEAAYASFTRLLKFLGLSLIPFFGFFILLNFINRVKNKKIFNIDFNSMVILLSSLSLLLPSLYAYMRGIDEIKYVLILIPLFVIISTAFSGSVNRKFLDNNKMFTIIILFIIISSISFIEYQKKDEVNQENSFLISQEIVKRTNVTNSYDQSGYLKASILLNNWPNFPKPDLDRSGKLEFDFNRIDTKQFENIEEFIVKARDNNLKFIVVDNQNQFFDEFYDEPNKFNYLKKVYGIDESKVELAIFEINYNLFDLRKR